MLKVLELQKQSSPQIVEQNETKAQDAQQKEMTSEYPNIPNANIPSPPPPPEMPHDTFPLQDYPVSSQFVRAFWG